MTSLLTAEARAWLGREQVFAPYQVTRMQIAQYAHTVGITDPVHFDAAAARQAGHADVVAPLGFHLVIRHSVPNLIPLSELAEDGGSDDMTPPVAAKRRMAGESSTTFHTPILAGDEIELTKRIGSMDEKSGRSGPLVFVGYDLEYRNVRTGELVIGERYVRILR
ncbi:MaoC family dehydratase N-terminal domain-containing protein [Nocardia sp. NPDC050378]|uniref:FAS1-like dehydratase domain-containing protein n=1 Tax=Nocardia sp. NPDC050378 TaxID=3155400 RepID=UPI0033E6CC03